MSGMTRKKAIKHLKDMKKGLFLWDMTELIDLCISALSENKGRWIDKDSGSYVCSNCKTEWTTSQIEKMCFCPTCGADMRGTDNECND